MNQQEKADNLDKADKADKGKRRLVRADSIKGREGKGMMEYDYLYT